MQRLAKKVNKKWTEYSRDVHSNERSNGHARTIQVVDTAEKVSCPLTWNLGVTAEGTLPGKGQ